MDWEPLASETLGVRSMALRVGRITIDPSASLAPRRFGLPPHPKEWEALVEAAKRILKSLERSEAVIITHYHRDHYNPGWLYDLSVLDGKTLFIKDFKKNVNVSQKIRGYKFMKMIGDLNTKIEVADARSFSFGDIEITFSPPLPHGRDLKLGYVLAVQIGDLLYTSDIQGGPREEHKWILERDAGVVVIDGPPLYLRGYRDISREKEFIKSIKGEVIIDHHPARSIGWRELLGVSLAYNDVLGSPENLLEAKRKELYQERPVEGSWLKMKFTEMRALYFPIS